MGHSFADMDAVGAEAGLYCIARKHGKRAQMVIDLSTTPPERFWPSPGVAGVCGGVHLRGGGIFENEAGRSGHCGGHQPPRHGGEPPSCWSPATGWR